MTRFKVAIVFGAVAVLVLLSAVSYRNATAVRYDATKETKISGSILEVQDFFCPVTNETGTHLHVKTATGAVLVHVGGAQQLHRAGVKFAVGENVDVLGARIVFMDKPSLLAREITRGNETVVLRDDKGEMLWR